MNIFLLILMIIILLFCVFLMIDTIILVMKSKNKRIETYKDILIKRLNLSMVLIVILAVIMIVRMYINK